MATENYNLEDPAKQEQIRRGHHEYIPSAGRHGRYQPAAWVRGQHNDYPKMMGKWPKPMLKDFSGPDAQVLYDQALKEWDSAMTASIVRSKSEEATWLKQNN
jgi:hypothetical protein